jgi:hypothetical protein
VRQAGSGGGDAKFGRASLPPWHQPRVTNVSVGIVRRFKHGIYPESRVFVFFFDEIHSLRLFYTQATLQLCVRTNDVRTVHMYAGDGRHRRRRVLAVLICACSTAPSTYVRMPAGHWH